jgi:hypothetical protein
MQLLPCANSTSTSRGIARNNQHTIVGTTHTKSNKGQHPGRNKNSNTGAEIVFSTTKATTSNSASRDSQSYVGAELISSTKAISNEEQYVDRDGRAITASRTISFTQATNSNKTSPDNQGNTDAESASPCQAANAN